jgi:GntR family transcriptional regulator
LRRRVRSIGLDQFRKSPERPAWVLIEERLTEQIESSAIGLGERLPPERELAESFGVSRMTVRQALASLEARGLLERGVGRGTFVRRAKIEHDLMRVAGFSEVVERQGLAPGARVLSVDERLAPAAVARALALEEGALVVRVERVRLGGGVPLALEDSWIPTDRFPGFASHDLSGSLYALMRDEYGLEPVRAFERLEPVAARRHEARALEIAERAPLMLVERAASAADGSVVEFARDRWRGDRARFTIQVSAGALTEA